MSTGLNITDLRLSLNEAERELTHANRTLQLAGTMSAREAANDLRLDAQRTVFDMRGRLHYMEATPRKRSLWDKVLRRRNTV